MKANLKDLTIRAKYEICAQVVVLTNQCKPHHSNALRDPLNTLAAIIHVFLFVGMIIYFKQLRSTNRMEFVILIFPGKLNT